MSIESEIFSSAAASFRANKGWADKAIAQLLDDKLHVALDLNTFGAISSASR